MKKSLTIILLSLSMMVNNQEEWRMNEGHTIMASFAFTTSTFVGSVASVDKFTGMVDVKKGVLVQFATGTGIAILKEILLDGMTNYNPADIRDFGFTMIGVGVGTIVTGLFLNGVSKKQRFRL